MYSQACLEIASLSIMFVETETLSKKRETVGCEQKVVILKAEDHWNKNFDLFE